MTHVDDEPEATEDERREAEALARALDGLPAEPPADAASTAAFLRAVTRSPTVDAHVAEVERTLFDAARAPSNVRRLPTRRLAYATMLLASAAAIVLWVRTGEAPIESATAPTTAAPSVQSVATATAPTLPPSDPSLRDAARALRDAAPGERDAAFERLRGALALDRDATLAALVAQHGGAP